MPEIDKNTELIKIDNYRFIRLGDKIIYSNKLNENHKRIALQNGVKEKDIYGFPCVDDGEYFQILEGKLAFSRFTITATIKGNYGEARNSTIEIAKNILGADKVF